MPCENIISNESSILLGGGIAMEIFETSSIAGMVLFTIDLVLKLLLISASNIHIIFLMKM